MAWLTFFTFIGLSNTCLGEISVIDDRGRVIVLDAPARRIISLAPHNTENLFTAGAGEYIVGTTEHSDYPIAALDIPRIGNNRQFNFEAILSAKPDLIVAWASGNSEAAVHRLINLGLTVFYSEPRTFAQIISNIERFSLIAATEDIATPRIKQMRASLQSLQDQYANKSAVKIFYQVWDQPLITLNGKHSVSYAFDLCSGVNVFANEPTIAPRVNIESVLAMNPELILLAGDNTAQSSGWLKKWQKWSAIKAVQLGQLAHIDADLVNRPTYRFFEGAQQICTLIDQTR